MSTRQVSLSGAPTDPRSGKPDTLRYCHGCEEYVLRSRFGPHDAHDEAARRAAEGDGGGDGGDDDGEGDPVVPERVGAWYDIKLSYSVAYRFRVPAATKHQAEEIAKEWELDARPADSYHVHTDRREIREILTDDPALPDDFDPYGSELLWEAMDRASEDADEEPGNGGGQEGQEGDER